MKMQKSLLLALGAGAAISSVAVAQSEIPTLPIGPKQNLGGSFGDRVVAPVYNAIYDECASSPFAIGGGSSYVMEDCSFNPGPWGATYAGARDVVQIDGMFQSAGWTGYPAFAPQTTTPQFFITHNFEWYNPGSFTAAPMLSNTTAIATRAVATNFGSGYAWNYTSAAFTTPVSLGTRVSVWVAVKAIDPGTGNRIADGAAGLVQPGGGGGTYIQQTAVNYGEWLGRADQPCVGSTTESYARDQNPNGPAGAPGDFAGGSTFIVGTSAGNANDWRQSAAGTFNGTTGPRTLTFGMRGDVGVTPPTPTFNWCTPNLADGASFRNATVTNAAVWGTICTTGPCTDDLSRYLNIDTVGSGANLSLALYDSNGNLLASDDNSADGTSAAQLTFGLGRAANPNGGAQYDGRDGQLTAAGTYYLAVAPAGSSFGTPFLVTAGPAVSGTGVINASTNITAGGNLPPVATPVINHFDFTTLGPAWTFPATDTFQGTTGTANPEPNDDASAAVLWSKFEIDATGATAAGGTYLDIDNGASDGADNVQFIFNTNGDLVSFADDQTAGNLLPASSFGATTSRNTANGQTRSTGNDPAFAWSGQNGDLAGGVYYVANVAWPSDVMTGQGGAAPSLGTNRRFHVRGLSGNNIGFTSEFYTGTGGCFSTLPCDCIDFNRDGLFPDTLDIDDFLSVFSGGTCSNDPNCGDIDFNNDTLFPDTLDIDSLLSIFSGGPCL